VALGLLYDYFQPLPVMKRGLLRRTMYTLIIMESMTVPP
jgi:hypothetical protein